VLRVVLGKKRRMSEANSSAINPLARLPYEKVMQLAYIFLTKAKKIKDLLIPRVRRRTIRLLSHTKNYIGAEGAVACPLCFTYAATLTPNGQSNTRRTRMFASIVR
jgi:hypothetical protein